MLQGVNTAPYLVNTWYVHRCGDAPILLQSKTLAHLWFSAKGHCDVCIHTWNTVKNPCFSVMWMWNLTQNLRQLYSQRRQESNAGLKYNLHTRTLSTMKCFWAGSYNDVALHHKRKCIPWIEMRQYNTDQQILTRQLHCGHWFHPWAPDPWCTTKPTWLPPYTCTATPQQEVSWAQSPTAMPKTTRVAHETV